MHRLREKANRKLEKATKQLQKVEIVEPMHAQNNMNARFYPYCMNRLKNALKYPSDIPRHCYTTAKTINAEDKPKEATEVNKGGATPLVFEDNSDSSCETLTSSSEEDESDEDLLTIVNGSSGKNDNEPTDSNRNTPQSPSPTIKSGATEVDKNKVSDLFWKDGLMFTIQSLGTDVKPIQNEEWIYFLYSTLKVICNLCFFK